jgi:hypothetical protein
MPLDIWMEEQLQQFGKSTWHPSNFSKTRKNTLQQFGKPTWQKKKLGKSHLPTRIYARAYRVAIGVSL